MKNQTNRYRLTAKEEANLLEMRAKAEKSRVLVIGDIHLPFERKDYLQFCKDTYKEYQCNRVVFIGDIIDCPLVKLSHYRPRRSRRRRRARDGNRASKRLV